MGERGPTPKPISEQKKLGTYRPWAHGKETVECKAPECPANISATAQAFWNVVAKDAEEAGYIAQVDRQMLFLAAEAWAEYRECMDEIESKGRVITEVTRTGERCKSNPAVEQMVKHRKFIYDCLKQFGLSPASRVGLISTASDKGQSEEDEVLKILKIS